MWFYAQQEKRARKRKSSERCESSNPKRRRLNSEQQLFDNQSNQSYFDLLPFEIVVQILKNLKRKELKKVAKVSHCFYEAVCDIEKFKSLLIINFQTVGYLT